MDSLLTLSASELARRIRSGEVSSATVVERHIERIEQVNPHLNAVVKDRFDQARREAKAADDLVRSEAKQALPPLHGVPCTIKESIALAGMPHSSGVVARADVVAEQDAPPVARLRAAGAIPLGVTNIPELTTWIATWNKVYGRTNNAYDARHIAGGSSGGEGAIIGAGGSPFGIGTDIGGSIRIPSFCNGIFGHKPTGGLVPGTGQYPPYEGEHCRKNSTGPMARRAADLMPLLRIIAGPDGADPGCRELALGDPESVNVSSLRVFVIDGDGRKPAVAGVLRRAQQRAASALARAGAAVDTREVGLLRRSMAIAGGTLLEEGRAPIPADLGDGRPISPAAELLRLVLRRSRHTYPPVVGLVASAIGKRLPGWVKKQAELGRTLRAQLEEMLGDDGVLLYPSARGPVPKHGVSPAHFRFTGLFNALELPSTQVPLGLDNDGLPLGMQVVGARGQDHLTIAVALELERAFGGWVPPAD